MNIPSIHQRTAIILILGIFLCLLAYSGSFRVGFRYDDYAQIVESSLARNWRFLPRLFTAEYFKLTPKRCYRPFTAASYLFSFAAFRLQPAGYHLFKLMLHLLNVLLLFSYLRRLRIHSQVAALAAALFALHPALSETIICISFVDDPLMTAWFLLALLAADNAGLPGGRGRRWYWLSLVFYLLALGSKELALIFPAWLFWQYLVLGFPPRSRKAGFWLGYLILSLAWIGVRFGWMNQTGWLSAGGQDGVGRLVFIAATYLHYLRVALFPVNLCLDYALPLPRGVLLLSPVMILILTTLAAGALLKIMRRSRSFALGAGTFLLALLPVSNIFLLPNPYADRYLYLPLAGFSLCLALLIFRLSRVRPAGRWRNVPLLAAVFISLSWTALIWRRNLVWQDPIRLWRETIRLSPNSLAAHNNLGWIYYKNNEFSRAEAEFRKALRRNAPYRRQAEVYTNLAEVQWRDGRKESAYQSLAQAVKLNPAAARTRDSRGHFYLQEGKVRAAHSEIQKALGLSPYSYLYYDHLAQVYAQEGELRLAEECLRHALRLRPDYAPGYDHLGIISARQGKKEEAVECWLQALSIDPRLKSARNNLAASGFQ